MAIWEGLALASALAGQAALPPVAFRREIVIAKNEIALSDVVDLEALPSDLRSKAAALVLFQVSNSSEERALSAVRIAARARALMPALGPWLGEPAGFVRIGRRRDLDRQLTAVPASGDGSSIDIVEAGVPVKIVARAGIFRIERDATALQPGKPGERFFVRTGDRQVLAPICCGDH